MKVTYKGYEVGAVGAVLADSTNAIYCDTYDRERTQDVQVDKPAKGGWANLIAREQKIETRSFSANRSFATEALASEFVDTHMDALPKEGTLKVEYSTHNTTYHSAWLSVRSRKSGVKVVTTYTFLCSLTRIE